MFRHVFDTIVASTNKDKFYFIHIEDITQRREDMNFIFEW